MDNYCEHQAYYRVEYCIKENRSNAIKTTLNYILATVSWIRTCKFSATNRSSNWFLCSNPNFSSLSLCDYWFFLLSLIFLCLSLRKQINRILGLCDFVVVAATHTHTHAHKPTVPLKLWNEKQSTRYHVYFLV